MTFLNLSHLYFFGCYLVLTTAGFFGQGSDQNLLDLFWNCGRTYNAAMHLCSILPMLECLSTILSQIKTQIK